MMTKKLYYYYHRYLPYVNSTNVLSTTAHDQKREPETHQTKKG